MRLFLFAFALLGVTAFSGHAIYETVLHHQEINTAQHAAALAAPYRHLDWQAAFH